MPSNDSFKRRNFSMPAEKLTSICGICDNQSSCLHDLNRRNCEEMLLGDHLSEKRSNRPNESPRAAPILAAAGGGAPPPPSAPPRRGPPPPSRNSAAPPN